MQSISEGTTGTNIANISIDKGGAQIPVTIRAAKPMDRDNSIKVQIDPKAIEQYNKRKWFWLQNTTFRILYLQQQ